jgi:hypothetical protein
VLNHKELIQLKGLRELALKMTIYWRDEIATEQLLMSAYAQ